MQSTSRTLRTPRAGQFVPKILFTFVLALACLVPVACAQTHESAGTDEGAGPDDNAILIPPSRFHGNWRVVARDDRGDSALMRLSIQHGVGEVEGSGDYVLFQPFCDALAGEPITGLAECETTDTGGMFDRVAPKRRTLVLVFRPTADGADHLLALRLKGDRMVGEYRNGDAVLPIVLQRVP